MADVFFALFAAVFLITRNYIFPVYVISSLYVYGYYEDGTELPRGHAYIKWNAFYALCILEILHIYWGFLILKMVKVAIFSNGVQDDIRNEHED